MKATQRSLRGESRNPAWDRSRIVWEARPPSVRALILSWRRNSDRSNLSDDRESPIYLSSEKILKVRAKRRNADRPEAETPWTGPPLVPLVAGKRLNQTENHGGQYCHVWNRRVRRVR